MRVLILGATGMLGFAIHRCADAPGHCSTTPLAAHSATSAENRSDFAVKYCAPWSNTASPTRFVASRPPSPRLFSKTTTSAPRAFSSRASNRPAIPAPTTAIVSFIK